MAIEASRLLFLQRPQCMYYLSSTMETVSLICFAPCLIQLLMIFHCAGKEQVLSKFLSHILHLVS
jgi:hypothetical protein